MQPRRRELSQVERRGFVLVLPRRALSLVLVQHCAPPPPATHVVHFVGGHCDAEALLGPPLRRLARARLQALELRVHSVGVRPHRDPAEGGPDLVGRRPGFYPQHLPRRAALQLLPLHVLVSAESPTNHGFNGT
jgi:hypothetical protein